MKHLLVVHTGGIGDFICTLPALRELARSTSIEIAGLPERAALAQVAGIASKIHDLDRLDFHSVFHGPSERLRAFLTGIDRAMVWWDDPDGVIQRALRDNGLSSVRCLPGIPPDTHGEHAAHWYARQAGVDVSLPFQLDVAPAGCPFEIVLHPGSGSRKKNWPLENYLNLAEKLHDRGHTVGWCVGPAEEDFPELTPRIDAPDLVALGPILAGARCFVGNDSGIGHLASVAGCPTIALFGTTDPAVWRPIGPKTTVLQGRPWPEVHQVFERVRRLMAED